MTAPNEYRNTAYVTWKVFWSIMVVGSTIVGGLIGALWNESRGHTTHREMDVHNQRIHSGALSKTDYREFRKEQRLWETSVIKKLDDLHSDIAKLRAEDVAELKAEVRSLKLKNGL